MRQVFAIIRKSNSSVMPIDLVNLCLYKKEAFRERIVRIENPCCKALDMGVAGYLWNYGLKSCKFSFFDNLTAETGSDDAFVHKRFTNSQHAFLIKNS